MYEYDRHTAELARSAKGNPSPRRNPTYAVVFPGFPVLRTQLAAQAVLPATGLKQHLGRVTPDSRRQSLYVIVSDVY
jgi:hypothetical protein